MTDDKRSFPKIPRSSWFLLREKFKQRTPERVTPSYLATALNMSEDSANKNIIPPLRTLGLIDDDSKPTDLAYDWRDDEKYAETCSVMFESQYPQEIRDLFHDPRKIDVKGIQNWFARHTKLGQASASKSASTYILLLEADLSKTGLIKEVKTDGRSGKVKLQPKETPKSQAANSASKKMPKSERTADRAEDGDRRSGFSPKLHVDIQIHISPDSSPEQIDRIFESMAKHLPFKE